MPEGENQRDGECVNKIGNNDNDCGQDDGGSEFDCEGLGILFEGSHPTTTKRFVWRPSPCNNVGNVDAAAAATSSPRSLHNNNSSTTFRPWIRTCETVHLPVTPEDFRDEDEPIVTAVVTCIDEDPGAVASGQYLWPASVKLCDYLVAQYGDNLFSHGDRDSIVEPAKNIRSILELGAGSSGMPSQVARRVFRDTLELSVVTDGDATALARARETHEALAERKRAKTGLACEMSHQNPLPSIRTEYFPLQWGSESDWQALQDICLSGDAHQPSSQEPPGFDLVLGSDLLDAPGVVPALLATLDRALVVGPTGRCLLAQSFACEDAELVRALDRACQRFHLERRVLRAPDIDFEGTRILEFRRTAAAAPPRTPAAAEAPHWE